MAKTLPEVVRTGSPRTSGPSTSEGMKRVVRRFKGLLDNVITKLMLVAIRRLLKH